jgi:hypothetical protein
VWASNTINSLLIENSIDKDDLGLVLNLQKYSQLICQITRAKTPTIRTNECQSCDNRKRFLALYPSYLRPKNKWFEVLKEGDGHENHYSVSQTLWTCRRWIRERRGRSPIVSAWISRMLARKWVLDHGFNASNSLWKDDVHKNAIFLLFLCFDKKILKTATWSCVLSSSWSSCVFVWIC